MSKPARILLLDSASLYYRAFYGVKASSPGPDGNPTNALRGFLDMVSGLVKRQEATHLVAAWDAHWRPDFRVQALPSYKAHRVDSAESGAEETPDELDVQVPLIRASLDALGIPVVEAQGFEADDVLATLCTELPTYNPQLEVDVVTGDRDLFQLVDDARKIRVVYTGRGMKNLLVVTEAELLDRYGVPNGPAYRDASILRGDPSDGLPGVPGIGEKGAAALISTWGSLDALETAAANEQLTARQNSTILSSADYLSAARIVVECVKNAPLNLPATDLLTHAELGNSINTAAIEDLSARTGAGNSFQRYLKAIAA